MAPSVSVFQSKIYYTIKIDQIQSCVAIKFKIRNFFLAKRILSYIISMEFPVTGSGLSGNALEVIKREILILC